MTEPLPRRTPLARQLEDQPAPRPGAPSRDLRLRAADGWMKFMRRTETPAGGQT